MSVATNPREWRDWLNIKLRKKTPGVTQNNRCLRISRCSDPDQAEIRKIQSEDESNFIVYLMGIH